MYAVIKQNATEIAVSALVVRKARQKMGNLFCELLMELFGRNQCDAWRSLSDSELAAIDEVIVAEAAKRNVERWWWQWEQKRLDCQFRLYKRYRDALIKTEKADWLVKLEIRKHSYNGSHFYFDVKDKNGKFRPEYNE